MNYLIARLILLAWLTTTFVSAVSVTPPVERTLTDEFERTTEVRVVGVTPTALEIVRVADGARFTLELKRLSEVDRLFAAELLKKIEDSRPLPETEWLNAVRRDFQVYDTAKKALVPLAADAYSKERIFVVAFVSGIGEPDTLFSRVYPPAPSGSVQKPDPAPVLWIVLSGDSEALGQAAESLPAGHAVLSLKARERAVDRGRPFRSRFAEDWYKRNQDKIGTGVFYLKPSDKEREELEGKLAKVMPSYWVLPAAGVFGLNEINYNLPVFSAIYRDGTPVKYRGVALNGPRPRVISVIRDRRAELE